jgi:uncharacterized MAPEG superfamily protein
MMSITTILVASAILTFLMLGTASFFRNQAWAPGGIARAIGNRDNLPPLLPIAGRADRAAKNMLENLAIFTALAAAVYFVGKDGTQARLDAQAQAQIGANIFFWMRVAYWPAYLAGIAYARTVVWLVSIAGLAMMAAAVLW